MTSLTAIFGNSQEESAESEKLLELYWNRAELKKEFANLREETFKLRDQVKTEQGRTARYKQKFDQVENLLLDPEWIYNVVVYYQLRALNLRCVGKVARFAEQLKQQREKRQHCRLLEAWNEERRAEAQAIEAKIGESRLQMQLLEDHLQAERHRLSMMSGFARFFRGRSITKSLDSIAENISVAQQTEVALLTELDAVRQRQAPDTQGLSLTEKRSINHMIVSFAQQMYLNFGDDNLASLVKEAGDKSVGAVKYGNKSECDFLVAEITKQGERLEKVTDFPEVLKHRARLIGEKALFKGDDEAVPIPGTVATLFSIDGNGVIREREVNLLGENYWDLGNVLSR